MYEYNFKFQKSGIGNMYNNNKDKQTLKCLSINSNAFCTYTSSLYPHRLLFVNKQLNFKPEEVKHPNDVNVSQCT